MDHGLGPWYQWPMQSMPISKFKATCLAVLDRVGKTGRPVRITRFGKAVAEIVPPTPEPLPRNWMGALRATGTVTGDLVEPTGDLVEWEVHR